MVQDDRRDLTADAPETPVRRGLAPLLGGLATVATMIVLIGFSVAVFFNPLWMAFEQDRIAVPASTGYTSAQVRTVTDAILADLIFGPPEFAIAVDGRPVLDAAERSHMVDVRNVLLPFGALLVISMATLGAIAAVGRRRDWLWRAVARGSGALVLIGLVVGVAALFFFDAAFLLFHLVFFPQGNFSFDPRTERLTQLFPDRFWTETSIGIASFGLAISISVTLIARREVTRLSRPPADTR